MGEANSEKAPPQLSPDGRWWWNGDEWRPVGALNVRAAKPRRRWVWQLVLFILVATGGLAYAYAQGQAKSASVPGVGECGQRIGNDDIKRVDCSDPGAVFRVTSRRSGTFDGLTACRSDPEATAYFSYRATSRDVSVTSFVLCLAEK